LAREDKHNMVIKKSIRSRIYESSCFINGTSSIKPPLKEAKRSTKKNILTLTFKIKCCNQNRNCLLNYFKLFHLAKR
jgi:hypothetical protein